MNTRRRLLYVTCVMVACVSVSDASGRDAIKWAREGLPSDMRPPDICILPTPRKMLSLGRRIPLGTSGNPSCAIVAPNAQNPVIANATETLASAISSAVGVEVPVVTDDQPVRIPTVLIVLATPESEGLGRDVMRYLGAGVSARSPGPQGYVIRPGKYGDRLVLLLAGSDDVGLLYAVYTAIQLIRSEGPDVWMDAIKIRDWPAIRHRVFVSGFCNSQKAESRKWYYDLYGQAKVNGSHNSGGYFQDYANARGIKLWGGLYIMQRIPDPDEAHSDGIGRNCWTDPGVQQTWLDNLSDCAAPKLDVVDTHDNTDAGWYRKYIVKFWQNRCSECKKKYPEGSPWRADADRFTSWHNAVKASNPDAEFCPTLPCYYDDPRLEWGEPYIDYVTGKGSVMMDPDITAEADSFWEYLEKLGANIPPDMGFQLETSNVDDSAAAKAYRDHLGHWLSMYQYAMGSSGQPYVTTYLSPKYYNGILDGFFYCTEACLPVLGFADYAWNPALPVAGDYLLRVELPKICKFAFGDAWAEVMRFALLNIQTGPAIDSWSPEQLQQFVSDCRLALKLVARAQSKVGEAPGKPWLELWQKQYTSALNTASVQYNLAAAKQVLTEAEAKLFGGRDASSEMKQVGDYLDTALQLAQKDAVDAAANMEGLRLRLQGVRQAAESGLKPQARDMLLYMGEEDDSPADCTPEAEPSYADGSLVDFSGTTGKYKLRFTGDISEGGRLHVRHRRGDMDVYVDSQLVGRMSQASHYWYAMADYETYSFVIPPLEGKAHELLLKGGGQLDNVVIFPGIQWVPGAEPWEKEIGLNGLWRATYADLQTGLANGYNKPEFDDNGWDLFPVATVEPSWPEIPASDHMTWWFRSTVVIPKEWQGRRVYLRLGMVIASGCGFINGHLFVDDLRWGQERAEDITQYVKPGEPNTLAFSMAGDPANGLSRGISLLRR